MDSPLCPPPFPANKLQTRDGCPDAALQQRTLHPESCKIRVTHPLTPASSLPKCSSQGWARQSQEQPLHLGLPHGCQGPVCGPYLDFQVQQQGAEWEAEVPHFWDVATSAVVCPTAPYSNPKRAPAGHITLSLALPPEGVTSHQIPLDSPWHVTLAACTVSGIPEKS